MEIKSREVEIEINKLAQRVGGTFASELGFHKMQNYLKGLLWKEERKNGWQMGEYLGDRAGYTLQQFIYRGRFSADRLRNELRGYVGENFDEEDGEFVIDETGF